MIAPCHKPVIFYLRYSPKPSKKTDDDRSESIEVQREACRRYCEINHLPIGLELSEPGVSGYKTRIRERVEGQRLLAELATKKYSGVVVMRLDRLSRRASDVMQAIEDWGDDGIALHLANQGGNAINGGTPEGMLFLTILAGFARFERDMISRRTSDAMRKQHRERVKKGNAPRTAGYKVAEDGVSVVPCPLEQAAIATIHEMTLRGVEPKDIAADFASNGKLFRGRAWSPQLIRKIVRRG